jgi:hypothetical protein
VLDDAGRLCIVKDEKAVLKKKNNHFFPDLDSAPTREYRECSAGVARSPYLPYRRTVFTSRKTILAFIPNRELCRKSVSSIIQHILTNFSFVDDLILKNDLFYQSIQ